MRSLLRFLLGLLLLTTPAAAQELGSGDRQAIQSVIERQVDAFRREDGTAAFGYATPDLQQQFGSAEIFMQMVRSGYQPVYRPRSFRFQELKTIDGVPTQLVHVVGPDGVAKLALYFMKLQPDGSWRISGCVLLDYEGGEA